MQTNSISAKTVSNSAIKDVSLIIGASLFIALMAQITIPLPFTPVPITMQTFAVVLVGAVLGSKRGALAVVTYLAEGFAGLPVFLAGTSGIVKMAGPTAGYLIGFVFAAAFAGYMAEKGWTKTMLKTVITFFVSSKIILIFGTAFLCRFMTLDKAITVGFMPFMLGDLFKVSFATALLPLITKFAKKPHAN